jgi:hypothetical protein
MCALSTARDVGLSVVASRRGSARESFPTPCRSGGLGALLPGPLARCDGVLPVVCMPCHAVSGQRVSAGPAWLPVWSYQVPVSRRLDPR